MYAQQQAEGGAADAAPGGQQARKDDADVVDAEFTEVKDKK
jgi:molecular chaperone DnaK